MKRITWWHAFAFMIAVAVLIVGAGTACALIAVSPYPWLAPVALAVLGALLTLAIARFVIWAANHFDLEGLGL